MAGPKITMMKTDALIPYARNPRTHSDIQVGQIAASIKEFGWLVPAVVDSENVLIAGHGRVLAAQKLGLDRVPTIDGSHLTPAQAKAFRIAENKLQLNAGWDDELLRLELEEMVAEDYGIDFTGFSEEEIADLLGTGGEGKTDPDDAPEIQKEAVSKTGDLWIMGPHRLLCGDCSEYKDVEKLFDGGLATVAVTSPPYASQRKYDESSGFKPIHPDRYIEWFAPIQDNISSFLESDGSWFVNIKEHAEDGERHLYVNDLLLAHVREWGWKWVDEFAWIHGGTPKAVQQRFKNGWEPIFQFARGRHKFRPDNVRHPTSGKLTWGGRHPSQNDGLAMQKQSISNAKLQGVPGKNQKGGEDEIRKSVADAGSELAYPSNVLSLGKNREALGHGAAYPIGLPEFFICAFSDVGDKAFDPFMGSGTTLIAGEKWSRPTLGMEISPAYCDVIVRRWQDFTGKEATLDGEEITFSQAAEAVAAS
jgi:DNA modification methylase